MKIKICGLFRMEDIDYANKVNPDYIGFVFAKSKRQVSMETAAEMKKALKPEIKAVGVFVDAPVNLVTEYLSKGIIDIAQLHGNETEDDIKYIKSVTSKPVIKAVKVRERNDVSMWLDSSADYLLFDNGQGTGKTFEWSLLEGVERDYFLAGGLNEENMEDACGKLHPYCLDVSSGAEKDGIKDIGKMSRIVGIARNMQENYRK